MKLISCYIENFGRLHEFRHTFEDGLNIIVEENGWGKSTFAAFVKAMFYGMDYTTKKSINENERKRYMPWQGGNYGGNIIFEVKGKVYRIERFFGAKDKDDTFALYDEVTGLACNDFGNNPGEQIFGLDAFAYERSTFIPQEAKNMVINDSLTAKLSNISEGSNDVDGYQNAINRIDSRIKYYKKVGDKGRIAELEAKIAEITHALEQLGNKTETYDSLKLRRNELDAKRNELVSELKTIREEMKQFNEYDGLLARKMHYDSLVKKHVETKSQYDSINLFFDRPELAKEIDKRKDDYDNLVVLDAKCKDESENLNELEYKKHKITEQYLMQKKTPVANFLMVVVGLVAMGCGVTIWALTEMNVLIPIVFAALGLVLALIGLITGMVSSNKVKNEFDAQLDEVEERIDYAKIAVREVKSQQEQLKKSLENYVRAFQVEQPRNVLKSLTEIEGKIKEQKNISEAFETADAELKAFEAQNEMDKLIGLATPKHSLEELSQHENSTNNMLMQIMEERNNVSRRMDTIANADEDENDLIQSKENLTEELLDCYLKYEVLGKTKEYLESANALFKTKYIRKMKDAFNEYVGEFNGMELDNVSIDVDLNVLLEDYGVKRDAEYYSTGYKDMLSLCTRFALVKAMYQNEQPFLILDDPFVNLDSARLENAMIFLKKMSANNQILYFTCHESRA